MSRIKSKDTKPELMVRKFLHRKGFRYKLHDKSLLGKPDMVFPRLKCVLFINGCFWHGHTNCKYFNIPKTRSEWWKKKIDRTISKDALNAETLRNDGWRVLTIWECQLKSSERDSRLELLSKELIGNG